MSDRFWTEDEVRTILGQGKPAEITLYAGGKPRKEATRLSSLEWESWPCGCKGHRLGESDWNMFPCGDPDHNVPDCT